MGPPQAEETLRRAPIGGTRRRRGRPPSMRRRGGQPRPCSTWPSSRTRPCRARPGFASTCVPCPPRRRRDRSCRRAVVRLRARAVGQPVEAAGGRRGPAGPLGPACDARSVHEAGPPLRLVLQLQHGVALRPGRIRTVRRPQAPPGVALPVRDWCEVVDRILARFCARDGGDRSVRQLPHEVMEVLGRGLPNAEAHFLAESVRLRPDRCNRELQIYHALIGRLASRNVPEVRGQQTLVRVAHDQVRELDGAVRLQPSRA